MNVKKEQVLSGMFCRDSKVFNGSYPAFMTEAVLSLQSLTHEFFPNFIILRILEPAAPVVGFGLSLNNNFTFSQPIHPDRIFRSLNSAAFFTG